MKDAAPRIFRSLERQSVQQFDTVVTAAITAYGALRHPSQRQADEMARLVVPLWTRIDTDTRRNVAAALSHSMRVPRALVDLLLGESIEVSAPFLISSPALDDADITRLRRSGDERVLRLLDNRVRRAEGPEQRVAPAPAEPAAAEADTAGERPAAAPASSASPSLSPEFLAETPLLEPAPPKRRPGPSVDGVREALRRLALTGRTPPPTQPLDLEALMLLAMERQEAAFYDMLAQALPIDARTVLEIAADATGERLAVALKALKVTSADAMSILMMLKPFIGLDVSAFDKLALFYRTLKSEDCRSMVNAARLQPAPRLGAAEGIRSFEPVRREFGRRTEQPAARKTGN
ncbi:hypothetical protein [Aureimonas sp. SK2]|uniref:hypothetical protein n=1 Tax=Aureimonas sp. SK2 TaxID=3015992 RepID=UPI002443C2D9|nr:hypothetical protein [Aureimonas sp. SK2]